ncbi:hypothetical protein GCM10007857_43810 [Bradyrhizobium iriomotense]|uniref:Uncharacterized protein n=1 Tax=Bradyrhizobium iriomotense TaxID=441950 RepID=A0ABQ6B447_9BRAD|nr:hypothetical protein GCM10007857_43810 [Bradyrhizobium iriomotense]
MRIAGIQREKVHVVAEVGGNIDPPSRVRTMVHCYKEDFSTASHNLFEILLRQELLLLRNKYDLGLETSQHRTYAYVYFAEIDHVSSRARLAQIDRLWTFTPKNTVCNDQQLALAD